MARYLQSESMELSPEGMVSKVNGLSNKCRGSEISDYDCIGRKVRDDFRARIKSFAFLIAIIIFVMLVTWFVPVLGPARDFFITIIQKNDLQTQIGTYSNIAQAYGIVLALIAAFTLYKRGKLSEKLDKTINDSLKLREKYDGHAFKKREDKIINWYGCIIKTKRVLPCRDRERLDDYVEWLKTYAKHREEIKCRLNWFICIHAIPLILYILLLFFHKTEFPQMINALILIGALVFLLFSFYLTYHIVKTLKE